MNQVNKLVDSIKQEMADSKAYTANCPLAEEPVKMENEIDSDLSMNMSCLVESESSLNEAYKGYKETNKVSD